MNNVIIEYIIVAIIGYILGCSNMAHYLSKITGVDIKNEGTKNLGASNTTYLLGKKAGLVTCLHDILKASLSVWIVIALFPKLKYAYVLAGAMSIIGHMYPFYLHFKGGKGFAPYLGVMLAIDYRYFLCLFLMIVIVVYVSDYIVFGTVLTTILSPIYVFFYIGWLSSIFLIIPSIIIIIKHKENFVNKKNKKEYKVRTTLLKKGHCRK